MANPLTWKTIAGANNAAANNLLRTSNQNFTQSLKGLADVANQRADFLKKREQDTATVNAVKSIYNTESPENLNNITSQQLSGISDAQVLDNVIKARNAQNSFLRNSRNDTLNYGFNSKANPLKLTGLGYDNTNKQYRNIGLKETNRHNAIMNPYQENIQGIQSNIASKYGMKNANIDYYNNLIGRDAKQLDYAFNQATYDDRVKKIKANAENVAQQWAREQWKLKWKAKQAKKAAGKNSENGVDVWNYYNEVVQDPKFIQGVQKVGQAGIHNYIANYAKNKNLNKAQQASLLGLLVDTKGKSPEKYKPKQPVSLESLNNTSNNIAPNLAIKSIKNVAKNGGSFEIDGSRVKLTKEGKRYFNSLTVKALQSKLDKGILPGYWDIGDGLSEMIKEKPNYFTPVN